SKSPRDYANTLATLQTDMGDITIKFFYDKAPRHVTNFVDLAAGGFYDGTMFHRVIPGFMIQGGDPNTKKPEDPMHPYGTGGNVVNGQEQRRPPQPARARVCRDVAGGCRPAALLSTHACRRRSRPGCRLSSRGDGLLPAMDRCARRPAGAPACPSPDCR